MIDGLAKYLLKATPIHLDVHLFVVIFQTWCWGNSRYVYCLGFVSITHFVKYVLILLFHVLFFEERMLHPHWHWILLYASLANGEQNVQH
jgi:hypothetical protein